jgi:hypothetical protein
VEDRRKLLQRLDDTVAQAIELYRHVGDSDVLVNESWTARDALVHIVFWHESFARNVADLAAGTTPRPLKGSYAELGRRAAKDAEGVSIDVLLARLTRAQGDVAGAILDARVVSIPYKVGSRPYGPDEHLSIVNEHVEGHLAKVRKAQAL